VPQRVGLASGIGPGLGKGFGLGRSLGPRRAGQALLLLDLGLELRDAARGLLALAEPLRLTLSRLEQFCLLLGVFRRRPLELGLGLG
jgi:hypothetical protein